MNLRHVLRELNPRTIGFVNVADPSLVEVARHGGFDAVVIDAEHGPLSMHDIQDMIRAGDAVGLPVMVRVPEVNRSFIMRALDAGAGGILAPQINSAAEAAAVVAECRYPPQGRRGAGFYARQYRFSADRGGAVLAENDEAVSVGVQIETVESVAAAAEIIGTKGVDYVFVGPTDLSVSHGSCDPEHPWVRDAIARVAQLCREQGVASGIYASTVEQARQSALLGFDTVAVGLLPLLLNAATAFTTATRASFGVES